MGVPLWGKRLADVNFNYFTNKCTYRIDSWMWKTLSFIRKLTLTQSVLAAQSTYTMVTIDVPLRVLQRLEREFKAFLWGHLVHKKGVHLLSGDQVYSSKAQKGLCLTSIQHKQHLMLCKLAAQLLLRPQSL